MKYIPSAIILFLLFAGLLSAQTHTFCATDTNCTTTGNNIRNGTETFNGGITSSGPNNFNGSTTVSSLQCKNLQNMQCVDFANTQGWSGTDIGGWINSAYAALPANGGRILVFCNGTATAANFSTPIVFQTSGKYVKLQGMCAGNAFGNGLTLNYTPTTATNAMTFDYTPAGGGGYSPSNGMSDISLSNASCTMNGGCGSSAIGVEFGNTNGGAHAADFTNVHISGFGKAMDFNDTVGWGVTLNNFWLSWNTTGLTFPQLQENIHWIGGAAAVNGTAINSATASDIFLENVSIDSNTVAGYTGIANFNCSGCHFENLGSSVLNYINASAGTQEISGGLALDDANSGTIAQMFTTAGLASVHGLSVFSGGRTITNLFNIVGGGLVVGDFKNSSPSLVPSPCTPIGSCYLIQQQAGVSPTALGTLIWKGDNWQFQPTSAVALPPLKFNTVGGLNAWAMGNKDCGGSATNDLVLCGTSSIAFGQNQAQRISAVTGVTTLAGLDTVGVTNDKGLQLFNVAPGAGTCPTAASIGATCTTAAATLPVGYGDTNYRLSCTGQTPTNVPVVETYAKSNTTFTITIAALTAAAASFASYDCIAGHN